jgi:hypothetical protein
MSSQWYKGMLTSSSWHGLEDVGQLATLADMLRVDAWPYAIAYSDIKASLGAMNLPVHGHRAVIGSYDDGDRVLGVVGAAYHATDPSVWRELVDVTINAGAKPTGAFALYNGSTILATFEVAVNDGIVTQLVLSDSYDGTQRLSAGFTSIRVVCANTLAVAQRTSGKSWAKITHTKSLADRVVIMRDAIATAIASGNDVATTYTQAAKTQLRNDVAKIAFDALFPAPAPDQTLALQTRLANVRREATAAAQLPINRVGKPGNLATLWNAATYLVDRTVDGNARPIKGQDTQPLQSMLFGTRARRIETIRQVIEVVMRDGTTAMVDIDTAREHGIDDKQIGKAVLDAMLEDA